MDRATIAQATDFLLAALAELRDDETRYIAEAIAEVLDGHPVGKGMIALAFNCHRTLLMAPDAPSRAALASALFRLIDPMSNAG